jgi:hypothetical protein
MNISRPFFIGVILVGPMWARAPTLVRASGNDPSTKDNSENTEHERVLGPTSNSSGGQSEPEPRPEVMY